MRLPLLVLLLVPVSLAGQGTSTAPRRSPGAGEIRLVRFAEPPVVDGNLDDPAWATAARMDGFVQTEPGDNTAPSHPTVALIGFTARSLFLAVLAEDDSGLVRASVAGRDAIDNDDLVTFYLDTAGERKRAYVFGFNPLGIQQDGVFSEGSETPDYGVDLVFRSRGRLTRTGWTLEVEIPWSSLRFSTAPDSPWHLQVQRRIRHLNNELDSWRPMVRGDAAFLSRAGTVSGIEQLASRRTLEVIPAVTGLWSGERTPTDGFDQQRLDPDVGVSARLGLGSRASLDLTVNPDFAQVEADAPIVTANQRFPTQFPEKRPFFLEGIELFQTPLTLVHTRTIADPVGALKLTGARGATAFGALVASDEVGGPNASVGILRARREFSTGTTLGVLATGYGSEDHDNVTAAVDGRFTPNSRLVVTAQLAGTWAHPPFYDPDIDRDVVRDGVGLGYSLSVRRSGRHFNAILSGRGRSPDWVADVGFTAQVNTNVWSLETRWNSEQHPGAPLISWSAAHTVLAQFDWDGRPTYGFLWPRLTLNFARLTTMTVGPYFDYQRIFEEEFGPRRGPNQAGAFFGAGSRETVYRGFAITGSSNFDSHWRIEENLDWSWDALDYDFGDGPRFPRVSPAALADPNAPLDPGLGATFDATLSLEWKPVASLRVNGSYTKSRLRREDTGLLAYNENLWSGETVLQLGAFAFVRLRADYRTSRSNLKTQFLLAWTPNPGTAMYLGYDDDLNNDGFSPNTGIPERGWQRNARTLFLKASWLFREAFP
jgi:hypothetical protein